MAETSDEVAHNEPSHLDLQFANSLDLDVVAHNEPPHLD